MTSQAPSRCIDQRHSCCSKTWLICIPSFLFLLHRSPLFFQSPSPCFLLFSCPSLSVIFTHFELFFLLFVSTGAAASYAVTSPLSPQKDSHAGKRLFRLNPLHNETQAAQTDVVQLYLSLSLSEIFVFFIILSLALYITFLVL